VSKNRLEDISSISGNDAQRDAGTSEDYAAGSGTLIPAYHISVLYTVGGGVAEKCNFQARRNNVPKFEEGSSLINCKDWLGGLDSNQDSQIQSLESYRLDDLPTHGKHSILTCEKRFCRNATA
jgi:hypothetical protein